MARCVGNSHEPMDLEVFCPKAFAGLAGLEAEEMKGPGSRLPRMLKPCRIEPHQIRFGAENRRGFKAGDLADARTAGCPLPISLKETLQTLRRR